MSKVSFLRSLVPRPLVLWALERRNLLQVPLNPPSHPLVLIFPGHNGTGLAADLRGFAMVSSMSRLGWRCAAVHPSLGLEARRRIVSRLKPNVLLFQQTRHRFNDPALFPDIPVVMDIDDADFFDPDYGDLVQARVAGSAGLIAGSRFIAEHFAPLGVKTAVVWTGSYAGHKKCSICSSRREPIITWAVSDVSGYPIERRFVVEVALRIARLNGPFQFILFGVKVIRDVQDFLPTLIAAGIKVETVPGLPYSDFTKRLENACIGLAPLCLENPFSRGKSFGKLLAYLGSECVIVTSPVAEHPLFFRDGENGFLRENDPDAWAALVVDLMRNPALRDRVTAQAKRDYLAELSTDAAAVKVDRFLRQVVAIPSPVSGT